MAHLVEDIAKYFQFEDVDVNNFNFKLYSKGCVILFFTGSLVGVMSQYFGEPIQCDFKGVDSETAKDYCWIHGSGYIPEEYQMHTKCFTDQVKDPNESPDTSYYQWVTFMQLFQAGMFMLPNRIWNSWEGGLIAAFGNEARSSIMLKSDFKHSEGVVMEAVVEKYVKYFRSILHHNQAYFAKFVTCELLNLGFIFFNFWATDQFLQGRFRYYGWEVIKFYSLTKAERKIAVNPFCDAFPKIVSCTMPIVGPSGAGQWNNAICVLSQNVINEKMYLVIWFYLTFVCSYSLCFLLYRICTLFFDQVRFMRIYSGLKHKLDPELKRALRSILSQCYLGDWFILLQLSKNVNHYFFREFVRELRNDLKEFPKGGEFVERGESVYKSLRTDDPDAPADAEAPEPEAQPRHTSLGQDLLNNPTTNPKVFKMQMAAKTGRPIKKKGKGKKR